ncbi:hypothetical protein [Anaerocolumna xylanovorans]|uniref:Cellobiose phosphorylase n=1 Tax=Anaerocolumna xylanovorans DSM 12503 TaxID=1121345 RepID=A0A1M7YGP7_9FIRM|nr:hypothetical protein [Anaerocolumna xylanovorans]SHO51817.1 hypothetical protein SAMN02745217_03353 [Anaerocolumna xylanovorans DSM 12503]
MKNYYLDGNAYVLEDYHRLPPFSSFLPGLAGIKGIPMWVYYTNRGQGVNSFGIHHKNNAIMEFNPANTAYENTAIKGFRTFIRKGSTVYEPFFSGITKAKRKFWIHQNSFEIEETDDEQELKIHIKYYVLPLEDIGALVRKVEITNLSQKEQELEVLDGLPKIIPYGMKNSEYKEMSNLLKSWSDIKNIGNNVPYYSMRSSSDDSAEVSEVEGGYYYLTVAGGEVVPVIYDAEAIFSYDTTFMQPVRFYEEGVEGVLGEEQCFANKMPCGFTPLKKKLAIGESFTFHTMIGFAQTTDQINGKLAKIKEEGFFEQKEILADECCEELTKDVRTVTGVPLFDSYIEYSYLDNFLRGGYPFVFGKDDKKSVIHLFSRKHGDPERDYNFFSINGEYYSQGNGNFRDVNQNRRNDLLFHKEVGDFNIKTFYQLIQIDGYNPLEVRPSTFQIKEEELEKAEDFLKKAAPKEWQVLLETAKNPFTPGKIAGTLARYLIELTVSEDDFLTELLAYCRQNIEAGFGEGYWSDHWDYNLDLIENYLKIYPEKKEALLFEDKAYRYYDSPARVLPRSEKYVITKVGLRQYGALVHDNEKEKRTDFVKKGTNWLKDKSGEYVTTTLMAKLLNLSLIKFVTLDPEGMGVEMEGGKPGWNDAMNGLPGLFGSGMPETLELKRMLEFVLGALPLKSQVSLPAEVYDLFIKTKELVDKLESGSIGQFEYWDKASSLREGFRDRVRFELDGGEILMAAKDAASIIESFLKVVKKGIEKAKSFGNGMMPTYFTYHADSYTALKTQDGEEIITPYGLPAGRAESFQAVMLPFFLEGPARYLASEECEEEAEALYQKVKESGIYDKKLNMYKTSESLENISMENGRIRAFTPGWLERESIFLHMEYKYLYGMQKAGLWERFYEDIKNTLIPFLPPEMYGRSILENSSFLASSENPNKEIHGRGYVARLSGSTTEILSMWSQMFIGSRVFTQEKEGLALHLEPKLPAWFFNEKKEVSFTFLSGCTITYKNPAGKPTYGKDRAVISHIITEDGERIEGSSILGETAGRIREGSMRKLIAYFV